MSAKTVLFARLQYLNAAINLPVLIDQGIAKTEHNGVANLLRKGLGIVAFNILEDFIKEKSIECLTTLSSSRIAFINLPDFLQEASTLGALNALSFRATLQKKDGGEDWKALIQEEALKIHSTKNFIYELSKFSLVYSRSNITSTEISDLLKAFGISGGWSLMKSVSDMIGGGLPDLSQTYKNAENRRHNSAHTANFQYDYQWISSIKSEILAIAASLDILLTARCRQAKMEPSKKLDSHNIQDALKFRFLEPNGSIIKETTILGGKSKKNWLLLHDAINHLEPPLENKAEFLIILNRSKQIDDWYA